MNYAAIKKTDVANGPGVRVSLFVSGCTHRCKGCFNSETWDFRYGKLYTHETEQEILQALSPNYIGGLSILGGEPMEPENRGTVLRLLRAVRACYPEKDIWCYTGYDYEKDLLRWGGWEPGLERVSGDGQTWEETAAEPGCSEVMQILSMIDVLVDGEFIEAKKNLSLAFRGSENQRLIDVQKSLQQGKIVCLSE